VIAVGSQRTNSERISSHGVITTTGTLAVGSYNIKGTTKDRYGDHGTFRFTVTVH